MVGSRGLQSLNSIDTRKVRGRLQKWSENSNRVKSDPGVESKLNCELRGERMSTVVWFVFLGEELLTQPLLAIGRPFLPGRGLGEDVTKKLSSAAMSCKSDHHIQSPEEGRADELLVLLSLILLQAPRFCDWSCPVVQRLPHHHHPKVAELTLFKSEDVLLVFFKYSSQEKK